MIQPKVTAEARLCGQRLRELRGRANRSGPEVASAVERKVGRPFDWPDLQSYEAGLAVPGCSQTVALAEIYKVTPDYIWIGRPHKSPEDVSLVAAEFWAYCGFSSAQGEEWAEAGWDLAAAVPWCANGFEPWDAKRWHDARLTVDHIRHLPPRIKPRQAAEWRATQLPPPLWREWFDVGAPAGVAAEWHKEGFSPEAAAPWISRSPAPTPSEARIFERLGLRREEADTWIRADLSAAHFSAWRASVLPEEDRPAWAQLGVGVAEAQELSDQGISVTQAAQWLNAGYSPKDALRWALTGLDLDGAAEWQGFDPDRVRRLRRMGATAAAVAARVDEGRRAIAEARESLRMPTSRTRG